MRSFDDRLAANHFDPSFAVARAGSLRRLMSLDISSETLALLQSTQRGRSALYDALLAGSASARTFDVT